MVTGCVIRKCSSVWSPISYTSYHCFPLKNHEMMAKWMKAIPPGYISIPKSSSRICSRHFLKTCFNYSESGKRTLKKDAIPTLFGSEAREEDVLSNTIKIKEEKDSDDSEFSSEDDKQTIQRYVKRSKYLQPQKLVLESKPINPASTIKANSTEIVISQSKRPKISNEEIQLKKQIIMLKKRLLRRETQIKSMMKVMNSFQNCTENPQNISN